MLELSNRFVFLCVYVRLRISSSSPRHAYSLLELFVRPSNHRRRLLALVKVGGLIWQFLEQGSDTGPSRINRCKAQIDSYPRFGSSFVKMLKLRSRRSHPTQIPTTATAKSLLTPSLISQSRKRCAIATKAKNDDAAITRGTTIGPCLSLASLLSTRTRLGSRRL